MSQTVGKIASDLLQKAPESRDPIEIEREVHKDYEKHIVDAVERGKKLYHGDFYIQVLNKRERLMPNVIRQYFFPRQSCPTPDYDQTVYKYNKIGDFLEFLWVLPTYDAYMHLKENALLVAPEERWLLNYVLLDADGSLLRKAKELNNEQVESPVIKLLPNES